VIIAASNPTINHQLLTTGIPMNVNTHAKNQENPQIIILAGTQLLVVGKILEG
jgi:hypothetical protein